MDILSMVENYDWAKKTKFYSRKLLTDLVKYKV